MNIIQLMVGNGMFNSGSSLGSSLGRNQGSNRKNARNATTNGCMPGRLLYALLLLLLLHTGALQAQSLEPRAYVNTPTGLNFLLAGYQQSAGALVFDPALPVTNANAETRVGFIGYVHTLGLQGKSAKLGFLLPYATLEATGYVNGNFRRRDTSGPADPTLFFSWNLLGAPALSLKEFGNFRQDTILGVSLKLTGPLGEYEADRLLNISTNRWSIEPGLGVSRAIGKWTLEASLAASLYTDNNDFDNGQTRSQDTIYASQFHVTYNFPRRIWLALSATYYTGGRTTVNGTENSDLQQNWRTGFTLALPVNRQNSIKLFGSSGVSTRTGNNFNSLGITWQHLWGSSINQ